MSIFSNLYAEKVFAEHPVGLWPLDDQADYVSLVSAAQRNMTFWYAPAATVSIDSTFTNKPINDNVYRLEQLGSVDIGAVSSPLFNSNSLNDDMATLTMGVYIFVPDQNVQSVSFGYTDGTSYYGNTYATPTAGAWTFLSTTYPTVAPNTNVSAFIQVDFFDGVSDGVFYVNGLSVGQWSEEFHAESLGVTPINLPDDIAINDTLGVAAPAYGSEDSNGYYIVNDNRLLGKNTSIPLVYGASNVTSIIPHPNGEPSVIVPGNGFLNAIGKYRDYTAEFWLRVDVDTKEPKRIFGPISSEDGVYVDGPFLTLRIGSLSGSHYVAEWYRPMLVDITYTINYATLILNGEQVITIDLADEALTFPDQYDALGNSNDWLGFYSYDDITPMEIDCVGIYSYQTSAVLAKRRWVYGQGVEFPENINAAYNGTSIFFDYPFANYSNSYNYPDIGKWKQGVLENISTTNNVLSPPEYSLPSVVFNNKTFESWKDDLEANSIATDPKIFLRPTSIWDDTEGYILFDKVNPLKQNTKGVYGVFELNRSASSSEQILFRIDDDASGNYLEAVISGSWVDGYLIEYKFKYGNSPLTTIFSSVDVFGNEPMIINSDDIAVGIDFEVMSRYYGGSLATFLGNLNRLRVYVGGHKTFTRTFEGAIHRFGFCTPRNISKISTAFLSNGFILNIIPNADAGDNYFGNNDSNWDSLLDGGLPDTIFTDELVNHIASYTLLSRFNYNKFVLDISTDSYWEDYVPLTYLGKNIVGSDGKTVYGLDFIQFNVDYPRPTTYVDNLSYDTSSSLIKTYVSFQYIAEGANKLVSSFTSVEPAPKNGVVEAGNEWLTTKYEVVNGTVIYPPLGIDFKKLAIVVYVDIVSESTLYKPVKLKNLQLSGKALNYMFPNPVGTRFGSNVYPYTRYGYYFNYKNRNPYTIYKGTTPYLYLNKYSGIQPVGNFDPSENRGVSIPINSKRKDRYRMTAFQTAIRFEDSAFPQEEIEIFEIQSKTGYTKFKLVSTHPGGKRGTIYAINSSTGLPRTDVLFFINGKRVSNPVISLDEWNLVGIAFINSLNVDGVAGAIRITGPILVNDISYYEETSLQRVTSGILRQWFGVNFGADTDSLDPDPAVFEWEDWDNYIWNRVLVLRAPDYYGVSPKDIYNAYAGTNKIVIDDDRSLVVTSCQYKVYRNNKSYTNIVKPV